jgi:DNA-3-methyladenine glycosylase
VPRRNGLIPRSFYLRPVVEVALDLLGRHLCCGPVALRITEVEAYGGPEDSASHCRFGRTARNAPMWEEGGVAYVFLCYGMHHMLNLVTGPAGEGSAVLIRACEPVSGLELIRERRGGSLEGPALLAGPGKVAQALGIDLSFNSHPLFEGGGLELRTGLPPSAILLGPRVGVPYAHPDHREAPLRFAIAGSPWVSRIKELSAR